MLPSNIAPVKASNSRNAPCQQQYNVNKTAKNMKLPFRTRESDTIRAYGMYIKRVGGRQVTYKVTMFAAGELLLILKPTTCWNDRNKCTYKKH